MESPVVIDPYALLGVPPTVSTEQLRRAFYDLSLICHPDKGGNAHDMRVVLAAYRHVLGEIQNRTTSEFRLERANAMPNLPLSEIRCESLGITPNDIRAAFDQCMSARGIATDSKSMLSRIRDDHLVALVAQDLLRDGTVMATPLQLYDAVDALIARSLDQEPSYASVPGGYGDVMAQSEDVPLAPFGSQEMILYKEPACATVPLGTDRMEITKTSMTDYTTPTLLDYVRAHQEPALPVKMGPQPSLDDAYAAMELARAMQDAELSQSINDSEDVTSDRVGLIWQARSGA